MEHKTLVSRDGVRLYYETYGNLQQGPVLFFLHGIGGDLDAWAFVREKLVPDGYAAAALDLRGHGYSGHPLSFRKYRLERLADDVAAVLEKEGLRDVVLIGHSGGAVLAAAFALRHPELLQKLVLISGSYCPPQYLRSRVLRMLSNGFINALALVSPPAPGPWHSPYPPGKFHKEVEPWGLARTIFHNSLRSYLLTSKELVNLDLEDDLPRITAPTLLLAGDKDGIYPPHIAYTMHKKIPHSRLHIVAGGNHVLILNNIAEVAEAILTFLKDPISEFSPAPASLAGKNR